jgi:hypothetical protein
MDYDGCLALLEAVVQQARLDSHKREARSFLLRVRRNVAEDRKDPGGAVMLAMIDGPRQSQLF